MPTYKYVAVGPDGSQVGVLALQDALRIARELDLDLVEVAPQARPPVARLLDYGFALPAGHPVGKLVDGAPRDTAGAAPPGSQPAPPQAQAHTAAQNWPGESGALLPSLLWVGLAVIVLGVLLAVTARQRHR